MLSVQDLHVHYGQVHALRGVSIELAAKELVAIVGANGAGKSTLMKVIMGLVPVSAGTIRYSGSPLQGEPAYRIARRGIALVPEGRRVFPDQTVRDNLILGAYSRLSGRQSREAVETDIGRMLEVFPRLKDRMTQPAGTLSGGEQQMLVLARALMSRPQVLLIDEPSLGLAPILVQEVFNVLRRLREQGLTILLVEQMAWMALETCDRAYILATGRVAAEGRGSELLANAQVLEAYLGRQARNGGAGRE